MADDPGGTGGLVAFGGGAVLESIFGANVPGTPVGLAGTVAAESLAADLAGESGDVAGIDFMDADPPAAISRTRRPGPAPRRGYDLLGGAGGRCRRSRCRHVAACDAAGGIVGNSVR